MNYKNKKNFCKANIFLKINLMLKINYLLYNLIRYKEEYQTMRAIAKLMGQSKLYFLNFYLQIKNCFKMFVSIKSLGEKNMVLIYIIGKFKN